MRFLPNLKDVFTLADPFDTDQLGADQLGADAMPTLAASLVTAGSTVATSQVSIPSVIAKASTATARPIAASVGSVIASAGQSVSIGNLFTLQAAASNPAYLILNVLDRNEYTVGYQTSAMGSVVEAGKTAGFSNFTSDGYGIGIVFTYQATTGQYINSTYGTLAQATFRTGGNLGDTATITLFGTSNAGLAASYAANSYVLATNPSYFTNEGSVAILTAATAATTPGTATPGSITAAAMSFVGHAWNDNGCWILASDIAIKAGTTLPVTSTLVGVAGVSNGEWIVAYNGPVASNANWTASLLPGEIVSFVTASGGGHITTVVSGSGAGAQLVDNITYMNGSGGIANLAHDGSAADIIVAAPHAASQEFTGVAAKNVVVYELDAPVVTAKVGSLAIWAGGTLSLAADFAASNPLATQSITQYQVYDTNTADSLTVAGVAQSGAHAAATALTLSSLATLGLATSATAGSDTLDVRAFNGSYWGDWTALAVSITAPMTVAQALAATGTAALSIADSASAISAAAAALQTLAAAGRISHIALTSGTQIILTQPQLTADKTLLALLPSTATVAVTGATVAQAAALQANAVVKSFSIIDSVTAMMGQAATLAKDSKLASFTATGTTNGGTLNLAGLIDTGTVVLTGNHASFAAGLGSPSLSFITAPDAIVLGTAPTVVQATLNASGGIDTVSNFQFGIDQLILNLGGGAATSLHMANTTVAGQHAISIYGSDATHGVVLLGEPASVTASTLLASHASFGGGSVMIG